MRKYINFIWCGITLLIALSFTSCQEEFEELTQGNDEETISATSSTAVLMEQTSSNDGSYDNIVDQGSCMAINFPYVVSVNGLEVTIDSRADIAIIKSIVAELNSDDYTLEIVYPITVTLSDYTEIEVNSKEQLVSLAQECKDGDNDDDIECVDFVYPITLYTFDASLSQTGTVEVNSDFQLRRFFIGKGDSDFISIDFPITLKLYDETEVVVNSVSELAATLESAKDACDEDDDNDYFDNDFTQEELNAYLVLCPWLVNEIDLTDVTEADRYVDYTLNFFENGTVIARSRVGAAIEGTWTTTVNDSGAQVQLNFDLLVDFSLTWKVYKLQEERIKFFAENQSRIIMKKACDFVANTPDTVTDVLKECTWIIREIENQGEEVNALFNYELNFMAEAVVTASVDGEVVSEGTWEITTNAQGQIVVAIAIEGEAAISLEWALVDMLEGRLSFMDSEAGNLLVLERICNDGIGDEDVMEIRNILKGGSWTLAQFKKNQDDITEAYLDYEFNFNVLNNFTVSKADVITLANGIWRVLRNADGELKVFLNFRGDIVLNDLTARWSIVSVTTARVELKHLYEDGSYDILVFEK